LEYPIGILCSIFRTKKNTCKKSKNPQLRWPALLKTTNQLVAFVLGEQRYALHLFAVDRIAPIVEVTPLPKAPEIVIGVINMQGQIIPVFNVRRRFRLPEREVALSDRMIIAQTSRRSVALIVDAVSGVMERQTDELVPPEKILPRLEYVDGVLRLEDGMILIHDLERFLSLEEEQSLDKSMQAVQGRGK
jgi:purine-binding chemotaxis protein CheW